MGREISAAIRRGLIEAYIRLVFQDRERVISAAIRRGLIEAALPFDERRSAPRFPRPFAAASLKRHVPTPDLAALRQDFRGHSPRPH